MEGSDRSRWDRCGRRQISALILPDAQVFFKLSLLDLPLFQTAAVAADGVSGRGTSSHRQRKNKESSDNHGFLI